MFFSSKMISWGHVIFLTLVVGGLFVAVLWVRGIVWAVVTVAVTLVLAVLGSWATKKAENAKSHRRCSACNTYLEPVYAVGAIQFCPLCGHNLVSAERKEKGSTDVC